MNRQNIAISSQDWRGQIPAIRSGNAENDEIIELLATVEAELEKLRETSKAWWVEIITTDPQCTYYFGPFQNESEASTASPGYVEDLEGENAQGIMVNIKRCQPEVLTIFDEDELN